MERLETSILGATITDCLNSSNLTQETTTKENNVGHKSSISINAQILKPVWNDLCQKLKLEGKINLYTTLENQKHITINDNILKIDVKSETQKKEIIENQHIIIEFLKKNTNAILIKIEVNIELLRDEKVLYTNDDKLKYMIKKNPKVLDLIKNLDLEIKE